MDERIRYKDVESKVIILGNTGVGKTAIIWKSQNPDAHFEPGSFSPTVGLDCSTLFIPGTPNHKVLLWDTAGSERFRSFVVQYFRGAKGVIYVFDLGNRKSFESIDKWAKLFRDRCDYDELGVGPKAILVGNKCDLPSDMREISAKEGKMKADMMGVPYFETSAKLGINIKESIETLVSSIIEGHDLQSPSGFMSPDSYYDLYGTEKSKKKCC